MSLELYYGSIIFLAVYEPGSNMCEYCGTRFTFSALRDRHLKQLEIGMVVGDSRPKERRVGFDIKPDVTEAV